MHAWKILTISETNSMLRWPAWFVFDKVYARPMGVSRPTREAKPPFNQAVNILQFSQAFQISSKSCRIGFWWSL
jgi:hypothetical protein